MRIYLTGASGFVGSNLAHVFAHDHGAEVVAPGHEHVDLTDEMVVRRSVLATRPDAIVHAAIWNDPPALRTDRRRAWDAYVGATRNVVAAANAVDAHVVLISTDWVFDGSQGSGGGASESTPPNPINTYGFLKACSELVLLESAGCGTVARIAGVQGVHRARPRTPRRPGRRLRLPGGVARGGAACGRAVRSLGRTRDQPAGDADARHRRRRARVAGPYA